MTRLLAGLALLVVLGLGAGCTAGPAGEQGGLEPAPVDVDTPQLRELRREAGVQPCPRPSRAAPLAEGLPEVTLPCLGGGPAVDLSGLRGPLVVSVWASWCGPCLAEMPILQGVHEKYAGRVGVLGIDYDDTDPAAALELARETGVTYPLLADPTRAISGAGTIPRLVVLPFLALVDETGRVVHRAPVAVTSRRQLEDLLAEHLGVA